jgi:hypothetical protein
MRIEKGSCAEMLAYISVTNGKKGIVIISKQWPHPATTKGICHLSGALSAFMAMNR